MASSVEDQFPCQIIIDSPFPTPRLASIALKALQVDKELSPLVRRSFSIADSAQHSHGDQSALDGCILRTDYRATTNRMLRVAVNSFMESLNLVLEVMENLDEDVLATNQESLK
ncbi:transcription factor Pcc1-domain-containing protein [Microdochium bolleyi]|uniref:Transcription factor Pcc1-domain-containing protein n=1 Tax=Microdochium bolleyi TaxID=196109 RepID=A0A136JE56_9PEZI|nr:transcription factor Pcc1-domain-containing protein [Microdochium bolleyi]